MTKKKIKPNNYMKKLLTNSNVVERWDNGKFWFVKVSENQGNDKYMFTYLCKSKQDLVNGKWWPIIAASFKNGVLMPAASMVFGFDKDKKLNVKRFFNSKSSHPIDLNKNCYTGFIDDEWIELPPSFDITVNKVVTDEDTVGAAFTASVMVAAHTRMLLQKSKFLIK